MIDFNPELFNLRWQIEMDALRNSSHGSWFNTRLDHLEDLKNVAVSRIGRESILNSAVERFGRRSDSLSTVIVHQNARADSLAHLVKNGDTMVSVMGYGLIVTLLIGLFAAKAIWGRKPTK